MTAFRRAAQRIFARPGASLWLATLAIPALLSLLALRSCHHELAYAADEVPDGLGSYVPEGYYSLVNREIAPHLELCPDNPQDQALMRPELAALGQIGVAAAAAAGAAGGPTNPCDAPCAKGGRLSVLFCLRTAGLSGEQIRRIKRFIQISPLRRDLRIFDRWQRVTGPRGSHRVALVEGARRQVLPLGAEQRGYLGRVLYRDSAPMLSLVDEVGNEYLLGGQGTTIAELGTAEALAPQRLSLRQMVRARDRALEGRPTVQRVMRGGVLAVTHGAHELRIIAPSPGATQIIVEVPQRGASGGRGLLASIDGVALGSHQKRRLVGLEDGQQLQLATGGHRRALTLRFFRRQSAVLSERQRVGDRWRRRHDEGAGFGRYLDTLLTGLEEAGRRLQEARTHCGADLASVRVLLDSDLRLTLDERLQHGATAALARYARVGPVARADEIYVARKGPLRGLWVRQTGTRAVLTPPPVMSLTVMDAASGELLALGAYPSRQTLLSMIRRLGRGHAGQPDHLLREHLATAAVGGSLHLKPHVIGSVFKPLLAWGLGKADPALLDVTLPRVHPVDWPSHPARADIVDQCLLPVGMSQRAKGAKSRFATNMNIRPLAKGCGGRAIGPKDKADVCAAIGSSDTYWFAHLTARAMLRAMGRPLTPAGGSSAERPDFSVLEAACAPQRHKDARGRVHTLCAAPAGRGTDAWFPIACAASPPGAGGLRNPLCTVAELFDVQVQAIGAPNPVSTGRTFLGPLYSHIDRLAKEADDTCQGVEAWRKRRNSGLLWALPRAPQWSQDLMTTCGQLTMFVQGGFINYWNNVMLTQALARVATGRAVSARLVRELVARSPEDAALLPAAPAPAAAKVVGPAECKVGDSDPLCRVREGMRLAVTERRGTLHRVLRTEALLNKEAARDHLPTLELRGKTGSGSERRPLFRRTRDPATRLWRWEAARGTTGSVHTALLARFREPDGERTRTFVLYLWVEGVDQDFTSLTGAVSFFLPKGVRPSSKSARLRTEMPGLQTLRSLRALAQAEWRRQP